jgi:hypothetical protein
MRLPIGYIVKNLTCLVYLKHGCTKISWTVRSSFLVTRLIAVTELPVLMEVFFYLSSLASGPDLSEVIIVVMVYVSKCGAKLKRNPDTCRLEWSTEAP